MTRIEPPGPDDGQDLPVVHFVGVSRSLNDSWDDDDLPISLEDVQNLELAVDNDEALNHKFYDTQFIYLLRELQQGSHIDYGQNEHIPMEHVSTLPSKTFPCLQSTSRFFDAQCIPL